MTQQTEQVPNPVVRETLLRAYPRWRIREYADGTFVADDTRGVALSPAEESFADALYFVRHGEPCMKPAVS